METSKQLQAIESADLGATELDAARYRWLRNQNWSESVLCVVFQPRLSVRRGSLCPTMEMLDKLIDDTMHIQLGK